MVVYSFLPKVDLHRHLDGDVRADVLFDLASKDGIELPYSTSEDLSKYFQELRDKGFVALLQQGFGLVTSLMQSKENIKKVAYEGVRNLKSDGIVYGEFRFAPQYHTGKSKYYGHDKSKTEGLSYSDVLDASLEGLREGERDFGVKTGLIVCIGREADPSLGIKVAEAAVEYSSKGVVALDLACDEASFPPERHKKAFELTFDTPLGRTVHAGEFGPQLYENMITSIQELKANRLGHARTISRYPGLIDLTIQKNVGLEMCPTSNVFCGHIHDISELEIPKLLRQGALVTVNTDDPAMFGYSLSDTFEELSHKMDLSPATFLKLQENALDVAFLKRSE